MQSDWQSLITDNPILRREAGLWPGRRLWRRPLTVAMAGMFLVWMHFATMSLWPGVWEFFYAPPSEVIVFMIYAFAFSYPLLRCGRAWSRERRDDERDLLRLTGVTSNQLLAGKTLLWVTPYLALAVGILAIPLLELVLIGLTGSVFGVGRDPFITRWIWNGDVFTMLANGLAIHLFAVGLMTRATLRWPMPWPFLPPILLLSFLLVNLGKVCDILAQLIGWNIFDQIDDHAVWIFWGLVALVWWHLPRRVGRIFTGDSPLAH